MDGDQGSTAIEQTFFLYENGQINLQLDKTGEGDAAASDLSHRYLWGDQVDQLFADENALGEVVWPLADHLNTARDLASYDAGTDTTTIENHRTFDSFGELTSETGTTTIIVGFTGAVLDIYTDLYNRLHRWYDFHTGRWASEDPIGILAGDPNFYRYVSNNPTILVDPSGLAEEHPHQYQPGYGPLGLQSYACVPRWREGRVVGSMGTSAPMTKEEQRERLQSMVEMIGGTFVEPYDWYLTGREVYNDPTNPLSYVGAIPGVPSAVGKIGKGLGNAADAARRGGSIPRTATPGKFTERLADYTQNPGDWTPRSIHAEPATSIRARGGVSEQIIYRNTQTGETLIRHRVTDAKGCSLDDHFRPNYKPRVGEVD